MSYQDLMESVKSKLGKGTQMDVEKRQVQEVQERFSHSRNAKEITKEKWKKWVKYYKGEHWSNQSASWKSRTVENVCFSTVESTIPLLGDRQPRMIWAV